MVAIGRLGYQDYPLLNVDISPEHGWSREGREGCEEKIKRAGKKMGTDIYDMKF
jgi:hypothetical protein